MRTQSFFTPAPSKSDRARNRLLEAAAKVFGEKGPEGASIRDIVQAAGQNVAAIAYYFGNKENLYRAVLEGIVREIRHRLEDVLGEIEHLRQAGEHPPAEALRLLQVFFRAVYLRLVSRNQAVPIGRLIVREQMQPTAGFEILYAQAFRQVHEALCFLVGTVLGQNPREREVIIRTHALMGQVYFFVMARETLLRRLGWSDLESRDPEVVAEILAEHVAVLLTGLAKKPGSTRPARGRGSNRQKVHP